MKILHVVVSLDPIYGGQPEVVKQLISSLTKLGHHSEIVTLDGYLHQFHDAAQIISHPLAPSYGKYHLNFKLVSWLIKNAKRFDCVICHGIWQFQSLGTWLASRFKHFPYFVYVHGALDPWFKINYPIKHLKKWLYWPWAEYNVLKDANGVLFTSEGEKSQAAKSFGLYKANGLVVNAGIKAPEVDPLHARDAFLKVFPELEGNQFMLFMGRIHPIKGCDNLIKVFSEFARVNPQLHLVMAGPDVIGWKSFLQNLAKELKIEDRITWAGMIEDEVKWGAICASDCLVLPSHTENFGMVVAEALACSIPVIITNKVNIWKDIENEKAGFVIDDSVEGLREAFHKWSALTQNEITEMKKNAYRCFDNHFDIVKNSKILIEKIQLELSKFERKS